MNTAAKVREAKEKNPENFCIDPRCLWRVVTRDGIKPCPKHGQIVQFCEYANHPVEILTNAIRHIQRLHMDGLQELGAGSGRY